MRVIDRIKEIQTERDEFLRQRDIAIHERDEFLRQRNIAIGESDEFLRQRNIAIGECKTSPPARYCNWRAQ